MAFRNTWFYSLFVTLLYILVWGYLFNNGDQAEHLPQVYHLQNPQLYANDFFIQEYDKIFTIRDYYVWAVFNLSYLLPVAWVCFILHVLAVSFLAYGIIRITQTLTDNKLAPYLAPLFALVVFSKFTVGGNDIVDTQFISASLAMPLATWAFFKLLNQKYVAAGVFAGLASVCQPLVGLQAFLIIYAIVIIQNKKIFFGTIVYTLLAYWAFSAMMLLPLIIRQFLVPFTGDTNLYLTLLYEFRNYDHYVPHLFPTTHYILFGVMLLMGGYLVFKLKLKEANTLKALFILVVSGLLFYTFCMETHTMYGLGKLQWFKTTIWITLFSSIFIAIKVSGWLEAKLMQPRLLKIYRSALPLVGAAMFFLIINSALIPALGDKYQIGNYTKSDLTLLHEWIEQNIDRDAVILTSPADNSFACEAKRAQPISFKAIIHEPKFLLEWYVKVKEVYGVSIENTKGQKAMNVANSLYKERNYKEHITLPENISYRIDNLQTCQYQANLGPIVHQQGDWVLTVF